MSSTTVRLSDLDYHLPPELIAQEPVEPRDASRLLVCRHAGPETAGLPPDGMLLDDRWFRDLPRLLSTDDLLVRNDTRVLLARTHFRRPTGGRLEVLFLQEVDSGNGRLPEAGGDASGDRPVWEVLVHGRPKVGDVLRSEGDGDWILRVLHGFGDGRWLVGSESADAVEALLDRHGETPLPPYIRRRLEDPERYQTTYAVRSGSAAAPTAGLHFTRRLDDELRAAGIRIAELTLHVGLGTFRPLNDETVASGRLHPERYSVPGAVWQAVGETRRRGGRVVAVGTTVVRTLEHLAAQESRPRADVTLRGSTDLFIAPGHHFRAVDALITNFHLPGSSLLALVMAFCGEQRTRVIYEHAVGRRYRFFSFGDAMLVTP